MKKAFTLIEILIVVSIMALIAAVVIPAFIKARDKAHSIANLSNTNNIPIPNNEIPTGPIESTSQLIQLIFDKDNTKVYKITSIENGWQVFHYLAISTNINTSVSIK